MRAVRVWRGGKVTPRSKLPSRPPLQLLRQGKYKDVLGNFWRQLTCLGKALGHFKVQVGKGKCL